MTPLKRDHWNVDTSFSSSTTCRPNSRSLYLEDVWSKARGSACSTELATIKAVTITSDGLNDCASLVKAAKRAFGADLLGPIP
jgi:hypothetical protein